MSEYLLRVLGVTIMQLSVTPDPCSCDDEPEDIESEELDYARLTTSDHSFGFAPDPLFRDDYWEDEE